MSDNTADVQRRFVRHAGVRIEAEMARYVMRHAGKSGDSTPDKTLVIMGADARTGSPIRTTINLQKILNS